MTDDEMLMNTPDVRWLSWAQPVAQLFQTVPVIAPAKVLLMPPSVEAAEMLQQACTTLESQAVEIVAVASPTEVEQAIALHQPVVVVCPPEVFGWVSKLAFLGACAAIYTCGPAGEGTLLDRARHFRAP